MASGDSFSVSVLKRVLMALDECGGSINRTNLAARTGLNYGTCVKYLDLLVLLGCVNFRHDPPGHVSITGPGRGLKSVLQGSNGHAFDVRGPEQVSSGEKAGGPELLNEAKLAR